MNTTSNCTVTFEGDYATLRYERLLPNPPEAVWKAITNPDDVAAWFNTKAVIDGHKGGMIDFVSAPAAFHTTGRILVWDPPYVFEHEWHIACHEQIPDGEPEAVIRWDLVRDDSAKEIPHLLALSSGIFSLLILQSIRYNSSLNIMFG